MRTLAIVAAFAATSAIPSARADDQGYGEQIMFADAGSIGLLVGVHDTPALGIASYAVLAPAVHLAHGQGERAVASLAMRLVPVASVASLARCEGGETGLGCALGFLLLGVVGALTVTAIDSFVIADGDAPPAAVPLMRGTF